MICPNCQASLLRKERTGNVCSRCGRPYAVDPKVYGPGMNDTRIRRIAEKVTDGGRRQVTVTQLWYLARTANSSWTAVPKSGRPRWVGRTVKWILGIGLVVLGVLIQDVPFAAFLWWGCVGVAALVYVVAKGEAYRPERRAGGYLSPALPDFRTMVCARWVQTYGKLPPGIVDDQNHRESRESTDGRRKGGGPRREPESGTLVVELLCPDRAVRVFLSANGIPRRLSLTLAAGLSELSGTGPVVVLHDASARGLQLVADARAIEPRRVVVDAGLPVRSVVDNRKVVRLYEEPPAGVLGEPGQQPDWLRQLAWRAPQEAAWVAHGWVSPVAAVPPAVLETAVERAVREARASADRKRQQAAAVGFMSWPQPSKPPVRDGN
ncbi:hypothetical protein [Streptomyces pseudovenezuelae]|uniref:Zinc ribbon domain-containing protein n=1 Tax=Streptomyces pseudovenezuelae TaxID=67350 RepID=A0ABT6LYK6_9ACTN|nr:hypothetical protein [Streptomyces pseudovenezuelae]MDH6221386.1 hypothetical protein [Streptomyces pseudovenezuelae]